MKHQFFRSEAERGIGSKSACEWRRRNELQRCVWFCRTPLAEKKPANQNAAASPGWKQRSPSTFKCAAIRKQLKFFVLQHFLNANRRLLRSKMLKLLRMGPRKVLRIAIAPRREKGVMRASPAI
ncbi:hypothetical protein [Methylocapsa aurea]|uniref:hypothetical protein n=1 Tax=Methylocapsa aurea TaxID=663610 RepID=UPI0012EB66D8|nr:hypothetical protein [Methylocapsa aurea]